MKEIPLLQPEDIEVKVKKVIEGRALLLLYKTARVDMAILDQVFGPENWCNDYREIKGNLYCGIGIREDADHDFIWKWDCGIESKEDDEGNQKKGEASDAFKRAGFKVGIGRELYTAPTIWIDAETFKGNGDKSFKLMDSAAKYSVKEIEYDDKVISRVVIVDRFGEQVYPSKKAKKSNEAKKNKSSETKEKQAGKGKSYQPPRCSICGKVVTPRRGKDRILSAEEVYEKTGHKCAACWLKGDKENKEPEQTKIEEVEV